MASCVSKVIAFVILVMKLVSTTDIVTTPEALITASTTPSTTDSPVTPSTTPTSEPVTQSPTSHSEHLRCYSCKYLSNLQNCRFAKSCPTGTACLTGQMTSGRYYLDCAPTPVCQLLPPALKASGKVSYLNHDFKKFECCTESKCNKNLNLIG